MEGGFLFSPAPFSLFLGGRPHCTPLFFRGGFMIPFMFSLIFDFSLRRGGGLFSILFTPIKFLIYLFDALRPRRAPTFWPAESRQRLAKEGCAPFGIPPAVALECPSGTTARGDGGTPRRFAAGASAPDSRGRLPAKEKQRTKTCAVFCLSFIPFKEKAYPARRAR